MSSPIIFALTHAQATTLDAMTRRGFEPRRRYIELGSLIKRGLVQSDRRGYTLTRPGRLAHALVRALELHKKTNG